MNRSEFLKLTVSAGLLACLPISCIDLSTAKKLKLGYQLYSIRDEMEIDPISTLKALKTMGYEDFEHYGFDADKSTYYGYKFKEFKKILDDLNLSISSGHYPFSGFLEKSNDELKRYVAECIEGALIMNSAYITWPWVDPKFRNAQGFKIISEKLNVMGEQISKAGLKLAYHNHGYEFTDYGGENGFDIVTNETDTSLVKFQIDMYWLQRSAKSPVKDLIATNPKRFVMWHIKDMDKVTHDYTELGNGSIDYKSILPQLDTSGLDYYYIEQGGNFTVNSTESAKYSATYFNTHLKDLF